MSAMARVSRPVNSGAVSPAKRPTARTIGSTTRKLGWRQSAEQMPSQERYVIVLKTAEDERAVEGDPEQSIWAAAERGIRLPAICHQGRCLTCAGRLLSGAVDQSQASSYFLEDQKAGFYLLCTAKPRSDVCVLTDQQWVMREH